MTLLRAGFPHIDNQAAPLLGRDGVACVTGDGTLAALRAAYGPSVNFALANIAWRAGRTAATEPEDPTGAWAEPEWLVLLFELMDMFKVR